VLPLPYWSHWTRWFAATGAARSLLGMIYLLWLRPPICAPTQRPRLPTHRPSPPRLAPPLIVHPTQARAEAAAMQVAAYTPQPSGFDRKLDSWTTAEVRLAACYCTRCLPVASSAPFLSLPPPLENAYTHTKQRTLTPVPRRRARCLPSAACLRLGRAPSCCGSSRSLARCEI
jgi:hypothetical protein